MCVGVLDRLPRKRLELRLAVDTRKVPALLQNGNHLFPLLQLLFPLLSGLQFRSTTSGGGFIFISSSTCSIRKTSGDNRVATTFFEPLPVPQRTRVQNAADVQQFLEPLRRFQLGLFPRAPGGTPGEEREEGGVRYPHFHLLLRRAVAVPDHSQHRPQFLRLLSLRFRAGRARRGVRLTVPILPLLPFVFVRLFLRLQSRLSGAPVVRRHRP
mmetsp:Transcript_13128/g.49078  ORF Transcript_13128/g.49078 Transcript_13128/m.49078 type:complete len:212 (+) Transcript_13128:4675-5310(+)